MIRLALRPDVPQIAGAFAPIGRPRLLEQIAAANDRPVALVVAPAGYGKSIALRQYLATLAELHVRYDVGPEHATLLSFLRGFSEAMAAVAPHLQTTLAGAYEQSAASSSRATDLALWAYAHLETFRGIVAIDDLHVAESEPDVARFLVALVDRSKRDVRWILASRSRAGFPTGRWLAYEDSIREIDDAQLRFTTEEAEETAAAFGVDVSRAELDRLLDLTGGWPLGVSLALRNAMRAVDLGGIASSTHETIYRYLADHVYHELDDEERDLLDVAAALPSIDVTLLERAGFDRAYGIVEGIAERTAFLSKAEIGQRYRCHDLFRHFLRRQLLLRGRLAQQAVYERAARTLEESGDVEHALDAYVTAEARAAILRLLERHGLELFDRARGDVVARAVAALDERTQREHPRILILRGTLHSLEGRYTRAESMLRHAIAKAGTDRDAEASARFSLAVLFINSGQDVRSLLETVTDGPNASCEERALAYSLIAVQRATMTDALGARAAIDEVTTSLTDLVDESTRLQVLHRIGIAAQRLGEYERGIALLKQALDLAEELAHYRRMAAIYASLAILGRHEDDDLDNGLRNATLAVQMASKSGDLITLASALLEVSSIEIRRGNERGSEEIERQLQPLLIGDRAREKCLNPAKALRLSWSGRFNDAHRLLADCWQTFHYDIDRVLCGAYCALFLALDRRRDESLSVVEKVLPMTEGLEEIGLYRKRCRVVALMFCALAEIVNGRKTYAERIRNKIRQSDEGIAESALRIVDLLASRAGLPAKGSSFDELADEFAEHGYCDVTRMLRAMVAKLSVVVPSNINETLTVAEREVLILLCEGLRPKAIAARKVRSVYTIQSHIASAIRKLGCQGRAEAILEARRRGLIP